MFHLNSQKGLIQQVIEPHQPHQNFSHILLISLQQLLKIFTQPKRQCQSVAITRKIMTILKKLKSQRKR
jgi:hypothetical protein